MHVHSFKREMQTRRRSGRERTDSPPATITLSFKKSYSFHYFEKARLADWGRRWGHQWCTFHSRRVFCLANGDWKTSIYLKQGPDEITSHDPPTNAEPRALTLTSQKSFRRGRPQVWAASLVEMNCCRCQRAFGLELRPSLFAHHLLFIIRQGFFPGPEALCSIRDWMQMQPFGCRVWPTFPNIV